MALLRRLRRRRRSAPPSALLAVVLCGAVLGAAPAVAQVPAGEQVVALGDVTATLSWTGGEHAVEEARLRIDRAGVTEFGQGIPDVCDLCVLDPGALQVVDLDGDAEPEVLVEASTGGAHCCSVLGIYDRRPATTGYGHVVQGFGNVGFTLEDLDGDGTPEVRSADDRFAYAFAAYAFSGFPLQVWDYRRSPRVGLVDVTRRFPALLRSDAARHREVLRRAGRAGGDLRSVLAAYVADQYLLGRGKVGRAEIARQRRRSRLGTKKDTVWPGGSRYEPALLQALKGWGYR